MGELVLFDLDRRADDQAEQLTGQLEVAEALGEQATAQVVELSDYRQGRLFDMPDGAA